MRGTDEQTGAMFSYLSPDALVPPDHPLRSIRPLVNAALERLSPQFSKLCSPGGRTSIAPEKLLRALLLQAFYGVRSERQLMEQVTCTMLFRWFIGLSMDVPVRDVTVFTKNRERLLAGDIAVAFLLSVMGDPAVKQQLSNEHVSVDGTLIDAWASTKSFRRKDGSDDDPSGPGRNAARDFRGDKRSNDTHASVTDPDARLYRKSDGQPSRLCYMGHLMIQNRHGLIVDVRTTYATGRAEREAVEGMLAGPARRHRITVGSDQVYDTREHVAAARVDGVTLQIVRDWVLKLNADGETGLIDRKARGQPSSRLDAMRRAALVDPIENGPIPAIRGVVRWRVIELCRWLFEEYRVSVVKQTLSRESRKMGYRELSARPRHHAKSRWHRRS